jgi:outer membrane protein assembly factor BamA
MIDTQVIKKLLYLCSLSLVVASCNTYKYLPKEASLVRKNQIEFKGQDAIDGKSEIEADLETFIKQKPNSKFLFIIPREWLYFKNFRAIGQEPVVFTDSLARKSAKDMENFLKFKKGYYHAAVDYITDESSYLSSFTTTSGTDIWIKKSTNVTYIVSLGNRYKIRSIKYESDDKTLLQYLETIKEGSYIKNGDFVNYDAFEQEKLRLTLKLQNEGYQGFSPNFIEIYGDSIQSDRLIDIFLKFRSINNRNHTKYTIGKINVFTDYVKDNLDVSVKQESLFNATYLRLSNKYLVSPSILQKKISLIPGDILRKDDKTNTFRQLSNLSTYRFITINPTKDAIYDSIMNFDIILTPYAYKWTLDGEVGAYLSTLNRQYLWGLKASSTLQNRNTFGGSEVYSLRLEVGSEFGRNGSSIFVPRTANILFQNKLTFPTYRDYIGLGRLIHSLGIISEKYYRPFTKDATTDVQVGYNYLNILNFYNITSINGSYGYEYNTPKGNRYIFKPFGVNFDVYNIEDSSRFVDNPRAVLSFKDNLGTGFLFRDFTFFINKPKNKFGWILSIYNNFELSGLEVDLINRAYNAITGKNEEWRVHASRDVQFARYIRDEIDLRFRKEIGLKNALAARVNLGLIVPFGRDKLSPFIRQFNAGGPNSMRGWRLSELGPGAYRPSNDYLTQPQSFYFNQGDFKFEINGEYRFNIFYFFDGAIFMDVGNVWNLYKDPKRPLAHLSSNFYNQLGISSGWGLRLNLDYFVIRFDFGYKIRSPYADRNTGVHWYNRRELAAQGIGNVQVAVNYAF